MKTVYILTRLDDVEVQLIVTSHNGTKRLIIKSLAFEGATPITVDLRELEELITIVKKVQL